MMQDLIDKIFTHYNFTKLLEENSVTMFGKPAEADNEYFILDYFDKDNFIAVENAIENALHIFEKGKQLKNNVEKNTSLIICVRADNFRADIPVLKNKILKLEEDNFWFKKYVLVYTAESIASLQDLEQPLEHLKSKLLDTATFNLFKTDLFHNEEYFLAIQLYLKLPFISVPFQTEDNFRSIDSLMTERLSGAEFAHYKKIADNHESVDTMDWARLGELIQDPSGSEEEIDEMLQKLSPDA